MADLEIAAAAVGVFVLYLVARVVWDCIKPLPRRRPSTHMIQEPGQ